MIKKQDVIKIIVNCAKLYKKNLENKNYLFVFKNNSEDEIQYFESLFLPRNFQHLTGIKINKNYIQSSIHFYKICLNNKLNPKHIEITGTVDLKLKVLPMLMELHKNVNMMGSYCGNNINLKTDKLAGNVRGCIGFIKDKTNKKYYVPNTVLKEDIRNIIKRPYSRVIAIYSKNYNEDKYKQLLFLSKNININTSDFPDDIQIKLDDNIIKSF